VITELGIVTLDKEEHSYSASRGIVVKLLEKVMRSRLPQQVLRERIALVHSKIVEMTGLVEGLAITLKDGL
jgi:hypothetical protein